MRISTQAFVRIEGERKVMEYRDAAGVVRPIEVELDLDQCANCLALLLPGDVGRHQAWHKRQ